MFEKDVTLFGLETLAYLDVALLGIILSASENFVMLYILKRSEKLIQ